MSGKRKNASSAMTVLFMVFVLAVVLFAFFQVRRATDGTNETPELTEVEKILDRDLESNYPGNAREVVKFYNRIVKCFYNEELSEEELKGLAGQARMLFDTELLKRNPVDSYMDNLKADIASYKEAGRTISNVILQSNSEVLYDKRGGNRTASLLSSYLMQEGAQNRKSCLRYYLREDENGQWRILFWELTDESI